MSLLKTLEKDIIIPKEPPVTRELLEYLDRVFPDSLSVAAKMPLDRALGRRDVLLHLLALYKKQEGL